MQKNLKESLNKIGWDIKGIYPNSFIFDQHGQRRPFRVMGDRIELSGEDGLSLVFYFDSIVIYELKEKGKIDCVGVRAKRNKEVFLQFYNHD